MVSTVKSRSSLYDVLGLGPAASSEQIQQAFARKMSLFGAHSVAAGAQICAAYETLRDPVKRRAYDRSIGLSPDPQPRAWTVAAPRWSPMPLTSPASAFALARPAAGAVPIPPLRVDPQVLPSGDESRLPSSIAASLREIAAPGIREASGALRSPVETPLTPRAESEPRPPTGAERALPLAEGGLVHVDDGAIEWKRPALAVGALVLTVGLFGAWAGWEAGNDVAAETPDEVVTLSVPPPAALPAAKAVPVAPPQIVAEARPESGRTAFAEAPASRAMPRPVQLTPAEEQELAGKPFVDSATQQVGTVDIASVPAAAEPSPVAMAAAKLPLPNAVVARTIGRIGYACGQVASTAAVEGAEPGVFKVTCTSGQSYRAAPVRGRYHFRRWGRD